MRLVKRIHLLFQRRGLGEFMRGACIGEVLGSLYGLRPGVGLALNASRINAAYYCSRNAALLETKKHAAQCVLERPLKTRQVGLFRLRWLEGWRERVGFCFGLRLRLLRMEREQA